MHLPIYKTFDVIIIPFPFVDKAITKNRPALVLSSKQFNELGNTIAMMITSKKKSPWPSDINIKELKSTGLSKSSSIRHKIFTLDNRLIKTKIGQLAPDDQNELQGIFQQVFNALIHNT